MKMNHSLLVQSALVSSMLVAATSGLDLYAQTARDTTEAVSEVAKAKKPIAVQDSVQLRIALFNNINSVPDNDPPGFSQYYIFASIPLSHFGGITEDVNGWDNVLFFRNLYITPTFNGSSLNYVPLDSFKNQYHANRLDMYQYAYFNLPVDLNVVTYIYHQGEQDYFHLYLYLLGGFMFTKDTSYSSAASHLVSSDYWGIGINAKSEKGISEDFTFEGGWSIFKINPVTSSLSGDLSLQYRDLADTALASNASKQLLGGTAWFTKLEAFIIYGLNSSTQTYIHFNYTRDLASMVSSNNYVNSFFQIQLGLSIDPQSFFKKSSNSGGKSNS